IRSVNGAEHTVIDGYHINRCATLENAVLTGFTLRNGYTAGSGGGSSGGTLNNCTLTGNTATSGGGAYNGTLNNCTLTGNSANGSGGGAYNGTLNNCMLTGNTASGYGGGAYDGTLNNCILTGNSARNGGGAGGYSWFTCTLNNCTLVGNTATHNGGGSSFGTLNNCIVWGNVSRSGATDNYVNGSVFNHSCTAPLPGGDGEGNVSADPKFESPGEGDFRLQSDSPCIDTGNNAYVAWELDLGGNPRIHGGAADMGAYEFVPVQAGDWYVSAAYGNDADDGRSWATAKKSIQAAVSAAAAGEKVVVWNGTYAPIVTSNKRIVIESVNGAGWTMIDGGGTNRCATLGAAVAHTNTVLAGFTLTNGWASASGGGSCYGTLEACVLSGNAAGSNGGGSYYGTLNRCTLSGNAVTGTWCGGGGAHGGTLNHCTLSGNVADQGGGAHSATLNNCTVTGNTAGNAGGVGAGGGAYGGTLNNCTVTANQAVYGGGVYNNSLVNNGIVWGNASRSGATDNYVNGSVFNHSCTAPLPGGDGEGNVSADPKFVDAESGDFRLQSDSPCIGKGDNAYVAWEFDLGESPRICGGTVDMGAYESGKDWVGPEDGVPVKVPCAWLDLYRGRQGMSEYASLALSEGANGMAFWQSYVAGCDPTDAADKFLVTNLVMNAVGGIEAMGWSPNFETVPEPWSGKVRVYTIEAKANLNDKEWKAYPSEINEAACFFRVRVSLP
ncbi:MAG: hypothetical protein FWF84_06645, partial [Kiritimatiellaeota bacterium]|nr:hypothetical protein [Kiritimatiellota bacterium]